MSSNVESGGIAPTTAKTTAKQKDNFDEFYTEVKQIEKRDSVLTSKQQIDRLLRPGSTYFNLNPFEVLQVEPGTPVDEINKVYRKFTILVHPDKNKDDVDRAHQAFEIVNRAWKTLQDDETRQKCLDIFEEAKERTDIMVEEKRKKLRKEGKGSEVIPEDDPEKYKRAVYVLTMKLFADMERKRQHLEMRDMEERKRKREAEIEEEERQSLQKEWAKNFERRARRYSIHIGNGRLGRSEQRSYASRRGQPRKTWPSVSSTRIKSFLEGSHGSKESRQTRVDSWKNFQAGSSKEKKKKKPMGFRPPKPKPEAR